VRSLRLSTAIVAGVLAAIVGLPDTKALGVEIGFRTGYAVPFGDAVPMGKTSDLVQGFAPIWLDVGYRLPHVYVGAFFQYGLAFVADGALGCASSAVTCSGSDVMTGVDLQLHALPDGRFDPWLGLGVGYEWVDISQSSSAGVSGSAATGWIRGWQLLNVQLGLDYKDPAVTPGLALGPFLMRRFGQYTNSGSEGTPLSDAVSIQNPTLHEWLTLGVRGAYDIPLAHSPPHAPAD
jgi:hypothetical protein